MLQPIFTNRFEKDVKAAQKRGKDLNQLKYVVRRLINQQSLEPKHHDHALTGNYQDRRECHIESDWLLIYKLDDNVIIFERTGTHSDLFR